jgi:hypothetical protein
VKRLLITTQNYEDIYLVFGRYLPKALKAATRNERKIFDILAGLLGPDITDTLIGFHAGEFYFKIKHHVFIFMILLLNFQGSDVTGKFATKSKEAIFKLLLKCGLHYWSHSEP